MQIPEKSRKDPEMVVVCLHVATRKRVGGHQRGPNMLKIGHDVYEVLFVEPAEGSAENPGNKTQL
jgi:hypothetical protein